MKESASNRLNAVEMFCAAAKAQSFTDAAIALGTTPSAISKAVRRLEDRLGVRLFERNTRAMRLSGDGQAYYEACAQALTRIQDAEMALTRDKMPRGQLRISLPYSYGIKRLIPLLPHYVERYQGQVQLEVLLSNATVDFVKEEVDLAVRLGQIADSRLVVRPLHQAQARLVASRGYLQRHGTPHHPDQLRQHRCIAMRLPDCGRTLPWSFACEQGTMEWNVSAAMTYDHPLGTLAAVLGDGGIAQLLDFTVDDELAGGRLVEVLADFRPPPLTVSAVYHCNRHVSAAVRSFLDFLVETVAHPAHGPRAG